MAKRSRRCHEALTRDAPDAARCEDVLRRFFESELMPPGLPQVQLVIWSLVFLAAPGLFLPLRFAGKYTRCDSQRPDLLVHSMLVDRLLFITLTMTALGVVALVIWDGIFPDRRDARILAFAGARPRADRRTPARALRLGRDFLAGNNLVPSLVFGATMASSAGAANPVRGVFAHLVVANEAGGFVFTALVALQGACLNMGGRRTSDRIAVLLQVFFVMALLQMIFFIGACAGCSADLDSAGWGRFRRYGFLGSMTCWAAGP